MNLTFHEAKNPSAWNKILADLSHPAFFQTWEWGDVEKTQGREVFRYEIHKSGTVTGIIQIFNIKARRGHFLHVRHGPVMADWSLSSVRDVKNFLKSKAEEMGASFVRISPLVLESEKKDKNFLKLGFRYSPVYNLDAENRWVLPIQNPDDVILSGMRKTTRYMIKKAEKENITVRKISDRKDFKLFKKIYQETAMKKGFIQHRLVREEYDLFKRGNNAELYLAYQNGKVLAGAVVVYSGNSAIYRHGATSSIGRKTAASYLVQWSAIQDAKVRGFHYYDFWGIAKDENPNNPWFGLSLFKKGFGGEQIDYVHSLDLPVSWRYWITFAIDFVTKIKKGHFLR